REIDSALQARMRHDYELLSEFVLRMGAVGGSRAPSLPDTPATERVSRDAPRDGARDAGRDSGRDGGREAPPPPKSESGLSWRDIVSGLRESEGPRPGGQPRRETSEPPLEARGDTAESLGADPSALSGAGARDAAHARRSAGIDAMREAVRDH